MILSQLHARAPIGHPFIPPFVGFAPILDVHAAVSVLAHFMPPAPKMLETRPVLQSTKLSRRPILPPRRLSAGSRTTLAARRPLRCRWWQHNPPSLPQLAGHPLQARWLTLGGQLIPGANLPATIDLDVELGVMSYICPLLAKLDYEARVRVLAWLARRFDVDTDALRF